MFSISKAILIKEFDFKDNDKILHFLKSDNNKITIFAPGVRKINSKNSRNIFIGHNSEIEYFFSPDKMSRLKKVTLEQDVNFNN
jgi:recombinational DNA repair protein (RecF pathway)